MTNLFAFTASAYGEAVARTLVHFLWQGAILGLLAWALLLAAARLRGKVRYFLACACLSAMAAAPVITLFLIWPESGAISAPTHSPVPEQLTLTNFGAFPYKAGDTSMASLLLAWLTGVLAFTARAAGGWILGAHQVRKGRHLAPPDWRKRCSDLGARLRIARPVRLFASNGMVAPSVFGWLRPVIIFPASAFTGLPPAHLEAMLAHELAHVVHNDFLANCLQTAVETLLFYHPAVWWVSGRIRAERESCCDELAVELCGSKTGYVEALLAVEERRQSLALAFQDGSLKARIASLLGTPLASRWSLRLLVPSLFLALFLAGAAGVVAQAQLGKESPKSQPAPKFQPANGPYLKWLNEDVVYIIKPEERARFESLKTNDERYAFIEEFWKRRDPTPNDSVNEAKEEHYRRIANANEKFGTGTRSGWTTDRGRIYIVNGPPAEIESHPAGPVPLEMWLYRDGKTKMLRFEGDDMKLVKQQ